MSKPNPSADRARPHVIGEVEVLSHAVEPGPHLSDVYDWLESRPPPEPIPEVSVVEDPLGSGVLRVEVKISLD